MPSRLYGPSNSAAALAEFVRRSEADEHLDGFVLELDDDENEQANGAAREVSRRRRYEYHHAGHADRDYSKTFGVE